jgi:DNA-binding MarR family transcriptional regulator
VAGPLPLSALLSQALVAFTIELDNAWESAMPHHTTLYGGSRRTPYATSLRQWSNFMRVLGPEGLTVAELERRTRAKPQLDGMRRWGYVTIAPDPDDPRPRPPARAHLVVPTPAGRQAQTIWRPLPDAIEERWRERFGREQTGELRATLQTLTDQLGLDLPQFVTDFYGGFVTRPPTRPPDRPADPADDDRARLPLSALLSQTLHAFALAYEEDARASLSHTANVLRLLDEDGARIAELPRRSGVGLDATRTATGILAKRGFIKVFSEPGGRAKLARLTPKGLAERTVYQALPTEIEAGWAGRFGRGTVDRLRTRLEALATAPGAGRPPLWLGLDPPPGSWRSKITQPDALPHFPMPRQGGHPDGT